MPTEVNEKGQKIVFKSKGNYTAWAAVGILFTIGEIASIYLNHPSYENVLGLIVFGVVSMLYTYKLTSGKYAFMKVGSKAYEEYSAWNSEKKQNDLGIFTYTNDGFSTDFKDGKAEIKWNRIETLIAYKTDLMTIDRIKLQITLTDDFTFTLHEDMQGWYQFQERLREHIPNLQNGWEVGVSNKPFKQNTTVLYDKYNRTLEEIISKKA